MRFVQPQLGEVPTVKATAKPGPAHAYLRSNALASHTARVVRALGHGIVSGRYPQHALLPGDAELMAEFGVSRTVLREALKTLSGKGLVRAKARIGTSVRERADWNLFDPDVLIWHADIGFDADFIRALGEMRLALEPEAAALAAERATVEQHEAINAWADCMAKADASLREFVDADLHFHLAVSVAAGNPFLRSISTLIEVALVAALTRSSPVDEPGGVLRSAAAHHAIADAIARRDPDAARAAMRVVVEEGVARGTPAH
jgi:DNA-binding FadR family transcriptional regulator